MHGGFIRLVYGGGSNNASSDFGWLLGCCFFVVCFTIMSNASIDIYCNMAGVLDILWHTLQATNHTTNPTNLNTYLQFINALVQIPYSFPKSVGSGDVTAQPVGGFASDLYKCVGGFV